MASILQEAQQQGLLDVLLAMVTHFEQRSIPQDRFGYPKKDWDTDSQVLGSQMTVGHWRRLDGSNPGWKQESLDTQKHDNALQVSALFSAHVRIVRAPTHVPVKGSKGNV